MYNSDKLSSPTSHDLCMSSLHTTEWYSESVDAVILFFSGSEDGWNNGRGFWSDIQTAWAEERAEIGIGLQSCMQSSGCLMLSYVPKSICTLHVLISFLHCQATTWSAWIYIFTDCLHLATITPLAKHSSHSVFQFPLHYRGRGREKSELRKEQNWPGSRKMTL